MAPETTYAVRLENVSRRFGQATALDQVCLRIPPGEFFSLLGPSGCGKTTLLRVIAGLETPDAGRLWLDHVDATHVPAHRRPVNTVFQSYALFPHLDVWNNVAFGLKMKGRPAGEIQRRVEEVCALVQLQSLERRRPHQLSGGQKQRVALARAIVNEPKVLLLDEPLAALDVKLREQLQAELRSLQRRLGITFVYVTHDQKEALLLSDRLALMHEGRIIQAGEPGQLYEHPGTRFAAQFLGTCTLIPATCVRRDPEGTVVHTEVGELRLCREPPVLPQFTLAVRPEKIKLLPTAPGLAHNLFRVRIVAASYAGAVSYYELRARELTLRAEVLNDHPAHPGLAAGGEAWAHIPAEALMVLDD
jgi:spermidine/putrescine transport system ATP-binding protein